MTLRLAVRADIPPLVAIAAGGTEMPLIDAGPVTDDACARYLAHSELWLWEEDGTILGFAAADPEDGRIGLLFVAAGRDGRGIGRALLRAACSTLGRRGHGWATLRIAAGTRAEGFYRAAGWREAARDGDGRVILCRALDVGIVSPDI